MLCILSISFTTAVNMHFLALWLRIQKGTSTSGNSHIFKPQKPISTTTTTVSPPHTWAIMWKCGKPSPTRLIRKKGVFIIFKLPTTWPCFRFTIFWRKNYASIITIIYATLIVSLPFELPNITTPINFLIIM